jgi:hypothetical protein
MPEILMALGLVGMGAACVVSARQSLKAEELKCQLNESGLTTEEYRKQYFLKSIPIWGPVVGLYILSGGLIIKADASKTVRVTEALAGYKIVKDTLLDYREAAIETVGEEKEKSIRDKLKEKRLANSEAELQGNAIYLFYDDIFGPCCYTSINRLDTIVTNIDNKLNREAVSLAEFYEELDMPIPEYAYEVGWRKDDIGGDDPYLELSYRSEIDRKTGEIKGYYIFSVWPERWYDDGHM